jgi:hypothetical protein
VHFPLKNLKNNAVKKKTYTHKTNPAVSNCEAIEWSEFEVGLGGLRVGAKKQNTTRKKVLPRQVNLLRQIENW